MSRKEINYVMGKILSDLNITEEELMDKFYCVRQVSADAKPSSSYAFYSSASNKEKYPVGEIATEICGRFCEHYSYETHNKDMMKSFYRDYEKTKDVHQLCYDAIRLLYDGLMVGFSYTISREFLYNKVPPRVMAYLDKNHYGQDIGTWKNFTSFNDSSEELLKLKSAKALQDYVVEEIKKYFDEYCFFIFTEAEVPKFEIVYC